jgi:hypothetical protein
LFRASAALPSLLPSKFARLIHRHSTSLLPTTPSDQRPREEKSALRDIRIRVIELFLETQSNVGQSGNGSVVGEGADPEQVVTNMRVNRLDKPPETIVPETMVSGIIQVIAVMNGKFQCDSVGAAREGQTSGARPGCATVAAMADARSRQNGWGTMLTTT